MGEPAGKPTAELYPRSSRLGLVAIVVALVVAGLIILLVTGGAGVPEEPRGDLTYIAPGRSELAVSPSSFVYSHIRGGRRH